MLVLSSMSALLYLVAWDLTSNDLLEDVIVIIWNSSHDDVLGVYRSYDSACENSSVKENCVHKVCDQLERQTDRVA